MQKLNSTKWDWPLGFTLRALYCDTVALAMLHHCENARFMPKKLTQLHYWLGQVLEWSAVVLARCCVNFLLLIFESICFILYSVTLSFISIYYIYPFVYNETYRTNKQIVRRNIFVKIQDVRIDEKALSGSDQYQYR